MSATRFTYADIRSQLPMRAVRRSLVRGSGAKLAFIWVLGSGALLTLLSMPLLAGAFTVACGVLAIPVLRDSIAGAAQSPAAIDEIVAERFPATDLVDPDLRDAAARGRRTLVEMAVRIGRTEQRGRADSPLLRVFADTAALHALQLESATQATDLDRILDFVVGNEAAGRGTGGWAGSAARGDDDQAARARREAREARVLAELRTGEPHGEAERLRADNLRAVLEESRAARETATTIAERMETMLLQAFQIERDVVDLSRASAAATESHETVARIQDVVDARRRAAARLGGMLSGEGTTVGDHA